MIRSSAIPRVAFGAEADGDGRSDIAARARLSKALGITTSWATISQVHGADVVIAAEPGPHGAADAIITESIGLPIAIATADCLPIAIEGSRTIAVVHAGWRGIAAGVIGATLERMAELGDRAERAVIGPAIGPCCYEVGDEVVEAVGGFRSETRDGATSVDLPAAARAGLGAIDIEQVGPCTFDDLRFASYRRDHTPIRQVTVAWLG